ncbi:MAG: type IV secretory system conjugative DNA transfer family protein [Actinomycetota bacterium]|nr:type IV secretory system conjugative DNA transfer family protein [Actinomycetota bacterium]
MSSFKRRDSAPSSNFEAIGLALVIGPVLLVLGTAWAATHVAAQIDGEPAPPTSPFSVVFGLANGEVTWSPTATKAALGGGLLLAILCVLAGVLFAKASTRGTRIDRAARHMGRGRQIRSLTGKGAGEVASRLGITGDPGLQIGRAVHNGTPLYQDWESTSVDIWGTRTGKSSTRAIPAIMAAPGAVIATSNKRDLVDATRHPRGAKGRVWVFDPQNIAAEPATWWWNPSTYVTDESKATSLASLFIGASREPGARTDAFFDGHGRNLISSLLPAAAAGDRPITDVYVWLSRPNDDEPLQILERADYPMQAVTLQGITTSPEKQRGGIYGTAQLIMSFLANRKVAAWATPPTHAGVPQFDAATFVRSTDTLHSLSREGDGADAGPLISAMTATICEAAEDYAKAQPGGRLPVLMVVVLDEAANVPLVPAAQPLLPLRLAWHQHSDLPAVVVPGRRRVGDWHEEDVGSRERRRLWWRRYRDRVLGHAVPSDRGVPAHRDLGLAPGGRWPQHQPSAPHRSDPRCLRPEFNAPRPLRRPWFGFGSGSVPTLGRPQPWYEGKHKDEIEASITAQSVAVRHG